MNKNILLISGLSILGLGFSTLGAQTTSSAIHASAAGQALVPMPTSVPTPRPHHHHHIALTPTSNGFSSTPVVGMAAPPATPVSAQGNTLNTPMGVPTSIPVSKSAPLTP